MAMEQARELYDKISDSQKGSINKAVIDKVNEVVGSPVEEIRQILEGALETASSLKDTVEGLPATILEELQSLPGKLNLDQLAGAVPKEIMAIMETIKEAAANPSILFPRIACCADMPVDPSKISKYAKDFQALQAAAGNVGGNSRNASSESFMTKLLGDYAAVAEPLTAALTRLLELKSRVEAAISKVGSLSALSAPIQNLLAKQQEAQSVVRDITAKFSAPDSGSNVVSSVKDGVGLVERAAGLAGEVEGAGSGVAAAGGVLAEVAEEVKGALEAGQALFAAAVALLPGLIEMLPKMIKEMQDFFVPTGLVAMLLKPSNQLRNIIDAVTSLQSAVPRPDQVEGTARALLTESEGAGKVEAVRGQLGAVLEAPRALSGRLAALSDLPDKVYDTTLETLKDLAQGAAVDMAADEAETFVDDIVTDIAGDEIGDAVGDAVGEAVSGFGKMIGGGGIGGFKW